MPRRRGLTPSPPRAASTRPARGVRAPRITTALVALLGAAAACGHATPAATPAVDNRAPSAPPPPAAACPPGGVTLRADLDGDRRDDAVRFTPDAGAATCVEIRATTAPALVCGGAAPPTIASIETDDGAVVDLDPVACDPSGAHAALVAAGGAAGGLPTPGRVLATVIPGGTAVWLDGGDASAAIVWRRGAWRWFVAGF